MQRHKKRPIRAIETIAFSGWTIKLYGISQFEERPGEMFLEKGKELARHTLPLPAKTDDRYGQAFVTVHQAGAFHQILVDWWENTNELRHRVFRAPPDAPMEFVDITDTGGAFCVWELRVLAFEREAWLTHVLLPAAGPDHVSYSRALLNEDA